LNVLAGLARVPPIMVVPGDGQTRFQPIAAQDVAACAVKSLVMPEALNKRLQICGPEVMTLEAIIDAIMAEMKIGRLKLKMPVPLLKVAVGLMDKTLPKPPVTPSLLAQLGVDNVATNNATERVFGITPLKLQDGIGFVREMTLGKLISVSLGKTQFR
jgi:NADH dehydrogenase